MVLTILWGLALLPTLLWWKDSILWVGLMSCWANMASHFSGWQAVRAEQASNGDGG